MKLHSSILQQAKHPHSVIILYNHHRSAFHLNDDLAGGMPIDALLPRLARLAQREPRVDHGLELAVLHQPDQELEVEDEP